MNRAALELLAYTYIDLIVMVSNHEQMGLDAKSIFADLQALDPQWYQKFDDKDAKKSLKEAVLKLNGPRQEINIDIPNEVMVA
jgi:hypothetical protein